MKTVKFYSVRRKRADGTYKGMYHARNHGLFSAPGYQTHHERHPPPELDTDLSWDTAHVRIGVMRSELMFGFSSVAQCKAWLYNAEWCEHMHRNDFLLHCWDMPEDKVIYGRAQAVASQREMYDSAPETFSLLDFEPLGISEF